MKELPVVRRPPTDAEMAFLARCRVAYLATVSSNWDTTIHPFCFALLPGDAAPAIVTALDEKPKSVDWRDLGRVRDILANPEVAIVADRYEEDWGRLAWVHMRGSASLIDPGHQGHGAAVAALRTAYGQYESMNLDERPIIRIAVASATSWSASGSLESDARSADFWEVIRGRRSVRAFSPDPVPREAIVAAIEAAGWAPSPHGRQPWRFAVLESSGRRQALADAMAETWRTQLMLDGQPDEVVLHRLERSKERLVTAPVLVIPCLYLQDLDVYPDADRQEAEQTMAIQSLGAAVQNFLLAIHRSGLDSGWMCAPLFCPDVVRKSLALDPALTPHALLPVGYAAKDPVRRPRRPVEELIAVWH